MTMTMTTATDNLKNGSAESKPITIVTTCTKKKMATSYAFFREDEIFENQELLAQAWKNKLENCPIKRKVPAEELYRGRGFIRIQHLRRSVPSKLFILSAGLGLVDAEQPLVPYNLTTSIGTDQHVKRHMVYGGFSAEMWWKQINKTPTPLADLIRDIPKGQLVVLALSRAYLEMVSPDLATLEDEHIQKVRLIGNELEGASPVSLFDVIMPYDNRLDDPRGGIPGGKIDFAQRAAQHFIEEIYAKTPDGTAAEHAQAVFESLNNLGAANTLREKSSSVDDTTIRKIVDAEFEASFGRFVRLLQVIRKKHGISVSENRLRRIIAERTIDLESDQEANQEE